MSFSQIEEISQFNLPQSAYIYRPWWANDSSHVQAQDGWLKAGWKVDSINLSSKQVTFLKKSGNIIKSNKIETQSPNNIKTYNEFEIYAGKKLSKYFGVDLKSGQSGDVPKLFDFVSNDCKIVGDAKYFTMVQGYRLPPAKFSVIAEHVWLLEQTNAEKKFLVFGNDKRVPTLWLKKYGKLVSGINFYFIDEKGDLEELNGDF